MNICFSASHRPGRTTALIGAGLAGGIGALAAAFAVLPRPAYSLPLFARQTGQECAACHTAFPGLTPFGRRFKLNGYTMGGGESNLPPFAVMLQPTFTHTNKDQPGGAAPHFGPNDNFALQEASLFTGGAITDHIGAFVQGTYDGVARRFTWDNTDIRYANTGSLLGSDFVYGLTLNNNPTVQDVWNTTPVWSFPYIRSDLAPTPAAHTLIEGGEAQKAAGLGGYAWIDDWIYVEFTGYHALSKNVQTALGVDTTGENRIDGVTPYWRVAFEPSWGNHSLEFGTFGLAANVEPQRVSTFGTDHLTDIGIDSQYEYAGEDHDVTIHASWIRESQTLSASQPLGFSDNSKDVLRSLNMSVAYTYDHTWSVTGGYFSINGSADAALYGTPNGSPNSSGFIGEIAYLPFSHGGPSFWPWLNARIGVQYIAYTKFDGARTNYDGTGRNASDNNTLFLYAWIMF